MSLGRCQALRCEHPATMRVEVGNAAYFLCLRHLNEARMAFEAVLVG